MTEKSSNNEPGSAEQWYDLGCIYRKRGEFGHAVNAFRTAAEVAGEQLALLEDGPEKKALSAIREKAEASVGLVLRITGFVNKDLMNP